MMAKSKFEYVKKFESVDQCLLNCWIVIRIDGRSFHRFTKEHNFVKPNDLRGISLMNHAASAVMHQFHDIVISYGESDEYSFVFEKGTTQFSRRASKLLSNTVSLFSSAYVFHWKEHFPDTELMFPPMFDGRIILYPALENIRDYLSWRQADCHINNLYNTCFWSLVLKGNMTTAEAEARLKGTLAAEKNEILFAEYGINYNNEEEIFKKGTVLTRIQVDEAVSKVNVESENETLLTEATVFRSRSRIVESHCDIIGDAFWSAHPSIFKT